MKKYIAFLLAALMLSAVSCSSGEAEESAPETEAPAAAENVAEEIPEETEEETVEEEEHKRPEPVEVINYRPLELEKDPVYDRAAGLLVLYFTDHEIVYPADAECSIGLISEEEAVSISGAPDMTSYPDMFVDDNNFCGVAIKMSEEIPTGDYFISVTFDDYIVTFDYTVQ